MSPLLQNICQFEYFSFNVSYIKIIVLLIFWYFQRLKAEPCRDPTRGGYLIIFQSSSWCSLSSLFSLDSSQGFIKAKQIYRVSQKKQGLVFRGLFWPLNDQKSKKQENRPPLKFNFTYWEGFPGQFYECIRYHYSTVSTPAPAAPLYH